jgi:CRISPR-associated endoribonuclease Cas6
MRLLLGLKPLVTLPRQETNNYYHLQGFIYSLLESSSQFSKLHNKKGYKFFCFSNTFSSSRSNDDTDIRYLIVSSPSKEFIRYIGSTLKKTKENKDPISIGKLKLLVDDVRIFETKLRSPFTLITGTPIVMRISKERYQKFNLETKYPYAYVYWRKEYPLEMFTRQLEENLCEKYAEFTGREVARENELSIFHKLTFKKQISTRISIHDTEQIVIGSLWEFSFDDGSDIELLQFGLDCGLGERNSMGFGFMNVKKTA